MVRHFKGYNEWDIWNNNPDEQNDHGGIYRNDRSPGMSYSWVDAQPSAGVGSGTLVGRYYEPTLMHAPIVNMHAIDSLGWADAQYQENSSRRRV